MAEARRVRDGEDEPVRSEQERGPRLVSETPIRETSNEGSLRGTAQELISDVADLLRTELRMARQEIRSDLSGLVSATVWLTVGVTALFLGVTFLLLAAVFALGSTLSLGWASLIVGGAVLLLGIIGSLIGWNRLRSVNPVPRQTINSVREDAEWLRDRTL